MAIKANIKEKSGSWQLGIKTFYLFPETGVLVEEDEIEEFTGLYPEIKDEEYYEVKLDLQKIHNLKDD